MSAVEITGVSKRFGAQEALSSVDLDVPAGRRTVVVGSSGSGKSTLLRLVSGFDFPDAGTIRVAGRTVADTGTAVPAHQRGIGHVAQDGALFPHLSVGQNVAFGLAAAGSRRERAARVATLLEMVSLDPAYAARRPDQLSGGEQQRVALARALARSPQVMLLDEPFSALDAGLREATRKVVAETLQHSGVTTVLVTHDRAEALSFADQLAVLRAGRLVQVGSPRELYTWPVDEFTATFLGEAVLLDALVEGRAARCALGTVPVQPPVREGRVRLLFRPEQLRVETSRGLGVGQVTALDFQGGSTSVTVRLDTGVDAASGPTTVQVRQSGVVPVAVADRVEVSCLTAGLAFPVAEEPRDSGAPADRVELCQ